MTGELKGVWNRVNSKPDQPPQMPARRGYEQPPELDAALSLRMRVEELRRTCEGPIEESRALREQAEALVRASRELRTALAAGRSQPPSARARPLPPREPRGVVPPFPANHMNKLRNNFIIKISIDIQLGFADTRIVGR
jgi:hypothetical protein